MALGIVVVGGNMDPADYYDKTTADTKFLTGITAQQVINALGYTPPQQDTTYGNATTSKPGLMSAAQVQTLNALPAASSASWQISAYDINYVRYSNGIQICWCGAESLGSNSKFTFPVPFSNTNYRVLISVISSSNAIRTRATTYVSLYDSIYAQKIVCIGRWR